MKEAQINFNLVECMKKTCAHHTMAALIIGYYWDVDFELPVLAATLIT